MEDNEKEIDLNDAISICGSDCSKCYCYGNMCTGCNKNKGIVFHTNNHECTLYECCVKNNKLQNCSECKKVPCDKWLREKDPKFSDEEFRLNIESRLEVLKKLNK